MSAYLRVTILGQHLQHRRFSALNVSHKNQFTPHNQRLRVSSFLHDENVIYIYIYFVTSNLLLLWFVYPENGSGRKEKKMSQR